MSKKTLREKCDDLGNFIETLCDEFVQNLENENYGQIKDNLQDIIFRSIVYYNMNQECVKEELKESYEKIKDK